MAGSVLLHEPVADSVRVQGAVLGVGMAVRRSCADGTGRGMADDFASSKSGGEIEAGVGAALRMKLVNAEGKYVC